MEVNVFIAFIAGFVAFLSPCIFPVIPSYIAYIGAATYKGEFKKSKGGILLILSFILGFTIIFTVMGIALSALGLAFKSYAIIISRVSGAVVIVLGLNTIFNFIKFLDYEKRFNFRSKNKGIISSMLLGMAFGAGWSPCIGPILASILFLAGNTSTLFSGTILLLFFSLGLGIPFLLTGLFITHYREKSKIIKENLNKIKIFSGVFITFIGIFIFFNRLSDINIILFRLADQFSTWYYSNSDIFNKITGFISFIFSILLIRIKNKIALIFAIFFFVLSVSSFVNFINWGSILTKYLTFQGI